MATKKKKTTKISKQHKDALAAGREQSKVVRNYLEALQQQGARNGHRPRKSPEELQVQIDAESDPLKKLELIQKRIDVEAYLAAEEEGPDLEALEAAFVEVAHPYAERKGLSYMAFRELEVPAATLRAAGIPRSRRAAAS